MKCHRCGEPMILKKFYDYGGYSWSWKCTRCGEIMDQMAPQNQPVKWVARSAYLPLQWINGRWQTAFQE